MIKQAQRKIIDPTRNFIFNKGEYVSSDPSFFTAYGEDFLTVVRVPEKFSVREIPIETVSVAPPTECPILMKKPVIEDSTPIPTTVLHRRAR